METSDQDAATLAPDLEEPAWMYEKQTRSPWITVFLDTVVMPDLSICPQVPVPRFAVGIVIGRNGEMIKKIQNDAGVRIQFKAGLFKSLL